MLPKVFFALFLLELVFSLEDQVGEGLVLDAGAVADHRVASSVRDHHRDDVQGQRPTRSLQREFGIELMLELRATTRLTCWTSGASAGWLWPPPPSPPHVVPRQVLLQTEK